MTQHTQVLKKGKAKKSSSVKDDVIDLAAKKLQDQADSADERQRKIAEAAYFIAEKRGFQGDLAISDWLQAEAAFDAHSVDIH